MLLWSHVFLLQSRDSHWPLFYPPASQGISASQTRKVIWLLPFWRNSRVQPNLGRKTHTSTARYFLSWKEENKEEEENSSNMGPPKTAWTPALGTRAPNPVRGTSVTLTFIECDSRKVRKDHLNSHNSEGWYELWSTFIKPEDIFFHQQLIQREPVLCTNSEPNQMK